MTRHIRILSAALAVTLGACTRFQAGSPAGSVPRIIPLAPSVTETLFALGLGDEVVGVSQYCDYPPVVRKLPRIGSFLSPNIEAIAGLRPTVVIGLSTSSDYREVRALKAMGIATLMVDDSSVASIEQSIIAIGAETGRSEAARQLDERLQAHLHAVAARVSKGPQRSVLMVVGHQPMVAVGRDNFLNQLLTLAHALNIAATSDQAWPRLSLEYIIARAPDVILDGQMGTDPASPSRFWSHYSSIPAVRNHRVFGYPDDPTLHPGPRIDQTLDLLAQRIYPEAYTTRDAVEAYR
jgi:iron complex transport system substrate-binding protein